jgi:hypothetical protein
VPSHKHLSFVLQASAYWHTHHNVVNKGQEWLHIWTLSIHDIVVEFCWTNQPYQVEKGTNITMRNITYLSTSDPFPAEAQGIIFDSGVLGSGSKPL